MLEYLNHQVYNIVSPVHKKGKKRTSTYLSSITHNYTTLLLTDKGNVVCGGVILTIPAPIITITLVNNVCYAIDIEGVLYTLIPTVREIPLPEPIESVMCCGGRFIVITVDGCVHTSLYGMEWKPISLVCRVKKVIGNKRSIYLEDGDGKWYSLVQGENRLWREDHVLPLHPSVTHVKINDKEEAVVAIEGKGWFTL